ncbi:LysR family transcriptional regulator [Vibrio sp. 10N.286.49.B3]|uniref:LysR family transcriptional regulator n=1 Tax=Vibrio sp. 10N.286.49.B3 TaxID=1880855 RepID=UPI000C8564C0|nr:LysR family transcriptional regulator [Vibrio sp. 10N.286.49.B3]PMH42212.1 LysR family transcriptional regulator [Vibrio sp. 10N.286.49.B3]
MVKSTEFNLIPIFVAIYEEKSLSKAAQRLDISQPAVSKALARLRETYDEPLFHRSPSGVVPTSFASDIYPALLTAYKNFTSTLSASHQFNPKISSRVFSIACISSVGQWLMPQVLKQIRQLAPKISLEVHPLFTEDYEMDLRLQRYDLVIDIPPKVATSLKVEAIYEEHLQVACSESHPRIKESITLEEYLSEEHIVLSQWQARRSLLSDEDILELDKRKVAYRAPGVFEMLPAIGETDLIALLPESVIKLFGEQYQIKALDLPFNDAPHKINMIWHPSRHQENAHQWLRKQIKRAAK